MAEDPTAPSLNLTAEEKRVFGQLFREADTDHIGVVTGEVAVKFFEKTRLEPHILGEIWQIADTENRGLLTPAGFGIVLRLIGHYQAGREPTPELALQPGPLPRFDGGLPGGSISPAIQPPPGPPPSALQTQGTGSGPIRVPPLTPDKVNQYAALFEKSGAQNGVLPGEQAKQIFERAGLPNEVLGRIWNLADTEQRGALVATEFVIAMHLLASYKSGAMRGLPNILPAGLYEAAARRAPSRQSSGVNAMSAIPRQFSGAGGRAGSPLSRTAYPAPPPMAAQATGAGMDWAITPGDKQKFDGIYATLDRTNKGFITGEEAVPFFSESKLPEEALAQIWDLADINSAGQLTRDEFAVAMYLIRQQRSRRDGRDALPASLPSNLIPPSMRNQVRAEPLPTAPAFDNPAPTMPKSAADDLFGLDALATPSPAAQVAQSTGGSGSFAPARQATTDPFGSAQPLTPTSPVQHTPPQQSSMFKPFAPSSSFGQSLTYNATGGSNTSGSQIHQRGFQQQSSASEDLLGDNDPEISSKLTNETTELANLSNQVGTLSNQMKEVQGQRATSQNELNQASSQKREFELRLAQLRSLYEQEAKDVRSLQEKLTASRNETKKLQTEMAMLEGTYQDLQVQHRDVVTALQSDQQENANLKERMRAINAEIAQLKPSLEKLRSDARQQKGLVAINKKQLATNEQEREKLKTEASELTRSIEEDKQTLAAAAQVPVPPTQAASPALSTASGNNPFFRRQGSSIDMTGSPFAASPAVPKTTERSFEDVFGPSFGAAATHESTPPTTSFKQEGAAPQSPNLSREVAPEAAIPPPPPESRINSSFLPFPEHSDSVTTSRQVSAPNSRFGDGSTGADTSTGYNGATPTGSSVEQAEATSGQSPELDRNLSASPAVSDSNVLKHQDSIPGAFPGDANSQILETPTGGSTMSDATDPFAAVGKEQPRPATAKHDFDSAFAGFGSSAKKQEPFPTGSSNDGSAAGASAGVNKEFPPIAELEHDDDSDSASDGGGFDDDFNPSSPGHARKPSATEGASAEPTSNGDFLTPRPDLATTASAGSLGTDPPTPGAQSSPPAYDKTVSPSEQAQSDLQQYSGLIPKREDPTSPEPDSSRTIPEAASQTPFNVPQSQPALPAKVPFDDDFDNDFDDLEDAKEGELDDDFANLSVHDRSGMDDFNNVFDSPPVPAKGTAHSDDFGSGNSGFGDFTQSPHPLQQQATNSSAVNDNHDWDAIFAGLDQPAAEAKTEVATEHPIGNGTSPTAERPAIGRALTEAGEHDDPILKNLTSMGYARNDALAALEKYDYNLERAANYLASQS
ncbi:putative UBA containing protein [Coleophoma cylindrospora]|uniref:Putative UBA containing protein n=1 Tax=Coleophoma cylindrospora TaxID=1849047 RepID=A0A3D8RBW6_9HELO|nr:putative UBA containing protein [Coleophoma cylindrospora]